MAFYPDELSPIDRVYAFGNSSDLHEINPMKNRRQWKSLVLGKKEMGLNNFATIAEEKEDEISSDDNPESSLNNYDSQFVSSHACGTVRNKKITFAKPRKYITSRGNDQKGFVIERSFLLPQADDPGTLSRSPPELPRSSPSEPLANFDFRPLVSPISHLDTSPPSRQPVGAAEVNVAASAASQSAASALQTRRPEREENARNLAASEPEEKKKSIGNEKIGNLLRVSTGRKDSQALKLEKKKIKRETKKKEESVSPNSGSHILSRSTTGGPSCKNLRPRKNVKQNEEKQKMSLNMKDVVKVYKNLAYGSEQEIKSFIQNLSFVKDDAKLEKNRNLLSVMNLKVLETKIKNFSKNSGSIQENSESLEKKSKPGKSGKKNRKNHAEKSAREKAVRVPAVPRGTRNKSTKSVDNEGPSRKKKSEKEREEKEPWRYVGMQSILDKTYLVYPAYPPSINLKKSGTKSTGKVQKESTLNDGSGNTKTRKKENKEETEPNGEKVKLSRAIFAGGSATPKNKVNSSRGTRPGNVSAVCHGTASGKARKLSSATTVCKVEFPPSVDSEPRIASSQGPETERADASLLVYLHGTKAINVRSPYSDRQFSRVKFFRRDARGMPLIKGLVQRVASKHSRKVSVKNVSLPNKPNRDKSLDLFDFSEDIQSINDFLISQENSEGKERRRRQRRRRQNRDQTENRRDADREGRWENRHRGRTGEIRRSPLQHQQRHETSWKQQNFSPDSLIDEISQNIHHLKYLPDTEENRKLIGKFFDDLDERIETSKKNHLSMGNIAAFDDAPWSIPILSY